MAAGGEQEHSFMWGAQERLPCDMPDDILRDAIESVRTELDTVEDLDGQGGNAVVERIKRKFDEKWDPNWHVIIGASALAFLTCRRSIVRQLRHARNQAIRLLQNQRQGCHDVQSLSRSPAARVVT